MNTFLNTKKNIINVNLDGIMNKKNLTLLILYSIYIIT